MRIGLMLGGVGTPAEPGGQAQQVVDAENDGFDSAWFGQVFGADALTMIALCGR